MRNRYPGTCYRCGGHVEKGAGHFERHQDGWRTQHAECAIQARTAKQMEPAASKVGETLRFTTSRVTDDGVTVNSSVKKGLIEKVLSDDKGVAYVVRYKGNPVLVPDTQVVA